MFFYICLFLSNFFIAPLFFLLLLLLLYFLCFVPHLYFYEKKTLRFDDKCEHFIVYTDKQTNGRTEAVCPQPFDTG